VRLQSAQLPADRALELIPLDNFVEVGAVSLAIFVVLALVAVVSVYAADPSGRRTDEMRHGLALLVTVEVIVAILLVDAVAWKKWVAGILCLAVGVLGVVASMLPHKTPDEDPEVPREPGPERTGWLAEKLDKLVGNPWSNLSNKLGPYIAREERIKPSLAEIDEAKERKRRGVGTGEPPTRWRRRMSVLSVFVCGATALLVAFVFWGLFPDDKWVAGSVLVAAALAGICFGVARASGDRFLPYGLAVFFSVILFGALLNIARLYDDPHVSPAALIRSGNSGSSGVVGLFIGKTDERYWLGALTAKCENGEPDGIVRGSGRLFSVRVEQVLDDEVGAPALVIPEGEDGSEEEPAGDRALDLLEELVRRQPPGGAPRPTDSEDTTTATETTPPDITSQTETTAPETGSQTDTRDSPPSSGSQDGASEGAPSDRKGTQGSGSPDTGTGAPESQPKPSETAPSAREDAAMVPQTLAVTGTCLHLPPRLIRLEPDAAAPGDSVEAIGSDLQGDQGPQSQPGQKPEVLLNGIPVKADNWQPESVIFQVPTEGARSGTVRVQVRARKSNGLPLTVRPNAPPVAAFRATPRTRRGREFVLDASASSDPEGGPLMHEWSVSSGRIGAPDEQRTTYTLPRRARAGWVILRVTDDHDQRSSPHRERVKRDLIVDTLSADETFDFGESKLTTAGKNHVASLLTEVRSLGAVVTDARILGYTDFVGDTDFNQGLSEERARTVERALLDPLHVPKRVRTVKGFGETRARARTWNDPGRANDRRVEITLVYEY
jgi:outer membrane protein OmpA-like peptidoglycan-associated protein